MSRNITIQLSETVSLEMIFVQGTGSSTFIMGENKFNNSSFEVRISDFWIGKYPLTQAQWKEVMGDKKPNPSYFKNENRPIENISWYDTIDYANTLNTLLTIQEQLKGKFFSIPTETQWEYAARGGIYWRDNYKFAGSNTLFEVGWYEENSHDETQIVGLKQANQLGIYDMSGNVSEWCFSKYMDIFYDETNQQNEIDNSNDWRVLRGGCWNDYAERSACTARSQDRPIVKASDVGFRLCLVSF